MQSTIATVLFSTIATLGGASVLALIILTIVELRRGRAAQRKSRAQNNSVGRHGMETAR